MYSLVLMTAMTAAPEAPQFGGSGGCTSSSASTCTGCSGSSYSNGCNGCHGCNGDPFWTRVRRWFAGLGCGGGCCGGSTAYSCYGSYAAPLYGCQGGMVYPGYPAPFPAPPSTAPAPTIPYAVPETAPAFNPANTGYKPYASSSKVTSGSAGTRATVIIRLPSDARLYAENRPLNLTGTERKFVTPELPAGQDYVYKFRVEYDRGGETLSVTRKVVVRPGMAFSVEFTDMTAKLAPEKNAGSGGASVAATTTSNVSPGVAPSATPTASPAVPAVTVPASSVPATPAPAVERAFIRVKLPPGATLYVDDLRNPSLEPVRQFTTPPLPAGKEYAYLMKAEVLRNGRMETLTQRVPFRAGERVDVDFTAGR